MTTNTIYRHKMENGYMVPVIYAFPRGAKILSATARHAEIHVYTLVELPHENFVSYVEHPQQDYYEFTFVGTGQRKDLSQYEFLSTVQLQPDEEVYHIFYRRVNEREARARYGSLDEVPTGYKE